MQAKCSGVHPSEACGMSSHQLKRKGEGANTDDSRKAREHDSQATCKAVYLI